MRHLLLLLLSFCLFVTNCKKDVVSEDIKETQEQIDARTIYESDISSLRYIEYELSTDAEKAVVDWQKFRELQNQTELVKKADFNFFKGDLLVLTTFLAELETEMPKQLQTNEILARLTALNTKAQKLYSLLNLSNIEKKDQLQGVKEFLVTISNLNLQINKKLEFDKNNITKPE